MEVVFADATFALVETDQVGTTRLSVSVIKAARRRLTILRAAPDERALRNWKSLYYERLSEGRDSQRSVRLNDQFRLVFTLDEGTKPATITILNIEDYR